MCFKRKPSFPFTARMITIHGRCYDVLVQANADGEAIPRPYTGKGMVTIEYHDGAVWRNLASTAIADDGLFLRTVALGYGQYRLAFHLAKPMQGGRFGPFCYDGVFKQDGTYTFRLKREDIVKAAAPMISGDIIIFTEGVL